MDLLTGLEKVHDRLTSLAFGVAQACLFGIVFAYSYEIVARYAFDAPTSWSNEVVSYFLCAGTFLALPEVTRRTSHIAITFLADALPPRPARVLGMAVALASAAVCLLVGWICATATVSQFARHELTMSVNPVYKAWISVWLPIGLVLAALHFLRQALRKAE